MKLTIWWGYVPRLPHHPLYCNLFYIKLFFCKRSRHYFFSLNTVVSNLFISENDFIKSNMIRKWCLKSYSQCVLCHAVFLCREMWSWSHAFVFYPLIFIQFIFFLILYQKLLLFTVFFSHFVPEDISVYCFSSFYVGYVTVHVFFFLILC